MNAQHANSLTGKTFVFTGDLLSFSHKQVALIVEAHGASVSSVVGPDTAYLVAGDSSGSRLLMAQSHGVPVLDEDALIQLLIDSHQPQ